MTETHSPEVTRGITEYDESLFVSTGRYPSLGEDIEVIEIFHGGKLAHLGDRWPVFTRLISKQLLDERIVQFDADPQQYIEDHRKAYKGGNIWEKLSE